MTTTQPVTHTILGEEFDYDELVDICKHGADTGVHGFTYSSDLHKMFESYEGQIMELLESLGYTTAGVFADQGFVYLQEFREWACWVYLEAAAAHLTDLDQF